VTLESDIRAVIDEAGGRWGVYARNLGTGESVALDGDKTMYTASAAKTFILVHYARLVAAGSCDPERRVTITADDQVLGTGVIRFLAPGLALTLHDLVTLMIIVSDNSATDVVLREVGGARAVNSTMDELGLPTARMNPAFVRYGSEHFADSSARDVAEVYTHLDDRCRSVLCRQQFVEGLPRRLTQSHHASDWGFTLPVRSYNKTGGDPGVYTDSGLFETDHGAWVAAALASELNDIGAIDDAGPRTAAAIGERLYNEWGRT
jgi:beta-lactamase class A